MVEKAIMAFFFFFYREIKNVFQYFEGLLTLRISK